MAEVKTEVKTYRIELACDECEGEMIYNGIVLTSNPPLYPHVCNKCGVKVNSRKRYPYLSTEE